MKPLAEGDAASFLDAQISFHVIPSKSTIADITELDLKLARRKLSPWQRIDKHKTFFYLMRTEVHLQCMETFSKTDWKRVDDILRPEIKVTLNLPQEASIEFIYGSNLLGYCGITRLPKN